MMLESRPTCNKVSVACVGYSQMVNSSTGEMFSFPHVFARVLLFFFLNSLGE